ncbi:MAG: hypothetical protein FWB77_06625 [Treponema sp.]|nr:hypothetical protein [Treponema sp.]
MKKTKKLLGIIAIVAIVGFGLAACGDDDGSKHTHTYSNTWSSNAIQHWKECTGAGCDAKTQTANHAPANDTCTTCGYVHTHTYVYTVTSTSYPAQSIQTCSCGETTGTARNAEIGDIGPAGGIIFYVAISGFTVLGYEGSFAEYTAYYMEADPERTSSIWGAQGTLIAGVTTWVDDAEKDSRLAVSIGVGRKDTQVIVNHLAATGETGRAAQVCASKNLNGFTDWFLPSLGELNEMYKAKGQTEIPTGWNWSSSQIDNDNAWTQSSGDYQSGHFKGDHQGVYAVRAF